MRTSTLATLNLLREAVVNPDPRLLSDSSYQGVSGGSIADALKMLCLLSQASQVDGSERAGFSGDPLAQAARSAAMSQQDYSARAAEVAGHLRWAKKMYFESRARQQEAKFKDARLAIAGRQVVSLKDLKTHRKWYGEL